MAGMERLFFVCSRDKWCTDKLSLPMENCVQFGKMPEALSKCSKNLNGR